MSSRNSPFKPTYMLAAAALTISVFLASSLPSGTSKATYASLAMPAPWGLLILALLLAAAVASLTVPLMRFLILPYLRRNGVMGLVPLIALGTLAGFLLFH